MHITLPDKYYLTHARELFNFVQTECQHLLKPSHKAYLQTFPTLSEDAQCLLIRCLTRKPRFLKIASLSYTEIGDLCGAITELTTHYYVGQVQAEHWAEFAPTLTKPQLLRLLKVAQVTVSQSTTKIDLLELAKDHVDPQLPLARALAEKFIVRKQARNIDYILFLFFGDLNHRLQKFAMRDLGVLRTRKSSSKKVARFESKAEALSAFSLLCRQRDFMLSPQQTKEDTGDYLLHTEPIGNRAIEIKDHLLLVVGASFTEDHPHRAIQLWRASQHPQATEKWIREAYKLDRDSLKEELDSMRQTELNATTKVFIEDFYARKYQGKRTSVYTDILRESAQTLSIDEAYVNDAEEGVVHYHQQRDRQAFFTENALWRTLFAFTFWDLLFGEAHVQHCEFDRLPALLRTGAFYKTFEKDIEACLVEFESPKNVLQEFTRLATVHYGKANGLFRWGPGLLDTLSPCIMHSPKGAIAKVLRRIAQDYQTTKDGYPDLMVVENSRLRFEEIKAPGDVLRPKQLVSINRLRHAGFQVDVTQIEWATNPNQVYAVVDIETTGSRKGANAITEIAVVKVRGQKVISEWSTLINPQRHIPAHITRLTGIDNTMVADAPLFVEIASELSAQLDGCIFVAHSVGFDYGFIKAAYGAEGLTFRKPKYCTVKNSRKSFPGLKSYSLGKLTDHFGIDLQGAHRALNDARATAELLILIQNKKSEN